MIDEQHVTQLGSGVLSAEQIRAAIAGDPPLVQGFQSLDEQVQPNGFDLTLAEVSRFDSAGILPVSNQGRMLADLVAVPFDDEGMVTLPPGAYQILINETVALPNNVMGLARPRSSLNRSGVTIHTAVWDAGYMGRSTALMHVLNPNGFRVQRNARVLQVVFFTLAQGTTEGYSGIYQGENIPK